MRNKSLLPWKFRDISISMRRFLQWPTSTLTGNVSHAPIYLQLIRDIECLSGYWVWHVVYYLSRFLSSCEFKRPSDPRFPSCYARFLGRDPFLRYDGFVHCSRPILMVLFYFLERCPTQPTFNRSASTMPPILACVPPPSCALLNSSFSFRRHLPPPTQHQFLLGQPKCHSPSRRPASPLSI